MKPDARIDSLWKVVADPKADTLDRILATERLRTELRALEYRIVAEARSQGATWAEIGHSLGLTKQAAYARYS